MKFHHAGWVVENIEKAAGRLDALIGAAAADVAPALRIVEDPIQQVRLAMMPAANGTFIELIEPVGETSPARKYLQKNGPIVYHVCFEVDDIRAAHAAARSCGGMPLSAPVPARLFDDRLIFFAYFQDLGLTEFLEKARP